MEGRWTIRLVPTLDGGHRVAADGPLLTEPVPVVPCDDAAIERGSQALYEMGRGKDWPGVLNGLPVSHVGTREVARAVLRAAGETP